MHFAISADGILHYGDIDRGIDRAAKQAHPNPTESQKQAGNYRKGHVTLHGLDISIETARGQKRRPEWAPMAHHYGYVKRTRSAADGSANSSSCSSTLVTTPSTKLRTLVGSIVAQTLERHHVLLLMTRRQAGSVLRSTPPPSLAAELQCRRFRRVDFSFGE